MHQNGRIHNAKDARVHRTCVVVEALHTVLYVHTAHHRAGGEGATRAVGAVYSKRALTER